MKGKILVLSTILFLALGVFLGFSSLSDNPKKDKSPESDRTSTKASSELKKLKVSESDSKGGGNQTDAAYYTDNFDGGNTVADLTARSYLVFLNGGPPGLTEAWFQGNPAVFAAFNGPTNGYVAANFNATTGTNPIDNWLILPAQNVSAGDAINFYCRSNLSTSFPDSVKVMYSAIGSVTPGGTWVELGFFRAADAGWELKSFTAPTAGATARFAIRYFNIDAGPGGGSSDYIGIDALTLESPAIANDLATISIDEPGNIALPTDPIAPEATFKNVGSANQPSTTIPVTYQIRNPSNSLVYNESSTIGPLAVGASIVKTFPATFSPTVLGKYAITVYCSLASDGNRANDTLRDTIEVIQPNYGGGGPNTGDYYFANSTSGADPAPSKPTFCWLDTSGSISLVVNSVASVPPTVGSLDDGYWAFSGLGGAKKVKFMGVSYDSIFIGTNGIIGFVAYNPQNFNWDPPANGLPGEGPGGGVRPAFYPSWNDINWGNLSAPANNRLSYKVDNDKDRLIITYDQAPLFGGVAGEYEKFQICIDFEDDNVAAPNSNIVLNIDSSLNTINIPFLIGLQDGTGANWLQYTFIDGGGNVISPGPLFDGDAAGLTVEFGPDPANLNGCCKELNLTAFIEGYWNGTTYIGDTLIVEIRSGTSPFNVISTVKVKNNASGLAVIDAGVYNLTNYYIAVRSRNAIETWSQLVQWNGPKLTYDFTTAANKAFGDNQVLKAGKFCFYSGDVNQDGVVDLADGALIDNDAFNFVSGYVPTDLNCDDIVDLSDAAIQDNNAFNFVGEILP